MMYNLTKMKKIKKKIKSGSHFFLTIMLICVGGVVFLPLKTLSSHMHHVLQNLDRLR